MMRLWNVQWITKNITYKQYKACELFGLYHSEDDFCKEIEGLPSGSACGPDRLSSDLIKRLKYPIARFLALIYRTSLKEGRFPENLKYAYVVGVFKGGEKTTPANYRPISLTNHVSKLLEKVVRKDIVTFMDEHNLWDARQHGSRSGQSTLSQLLEHYDLVINSLENGHNIDVIYLDFSKVYNKVDHWTLIQKVKAIGITGNLGKWISTFLTNRSQSIKIDDHISEEVRIKSGVPQGSVLGLILFLIYISDIGKTSNPMLSSM